MKYTTDFDDMIFHVKAHAHQDSQIPSRRTGRDLGSSQRKYGCVWIPNLVDHLKDDRLILIQHEFVWTIQALISFTHRSTLPVANLTSGRFNSRY